MMKMESLKVYTFRSLYVCLIFKYVHHCYITQTVATIYHYLSDLLNDSNCYQFQFFTVSTTAEGRHLFHHYHSQIILYIFHLSLFFNIFALKLKPVTLSAWF